MTQATAQYPAAFCCSHSGQLMGDPVMHDVCGRLFEKSVAQTLPVCPHDQSKLETLIPFSELKGRIQQSTAPLGTALGKLAIARAHPQVMWKVNNAHQDDVHGLKLFGAGFVSGSKDGRVTLWNRDGSVCQKLYDRDDVNYKEWVTAIGANSEVVISGTRNSWIDAWNKDGKALNHKSYRFRPPINGVHQSKQRNQTRINCIEVLAQLVFGDTAFFVGTPTHLHLLTLSSEGRFTNCSSSKVHSNDWAYCVQPLKDSEPLGDLLVVVGAQIDVLKRDANKDPFKESAWGSSESIVKENMGERGFKQVYGRKQILRALIPTIKRCPENQEHLAYTCFENKRGFGAVRIVDLSTRKILFDGQEHLGRAWDLAFVSHRVFASGGDDHLIKLWDARIGAKSIFTLPKQCGRVSCLASPRENLLLASSCPDNVHEVAQKASFTLWDLRLQK